MKLLEIIKEDGMYKVVFRSSRICVYKSMRRINCKDYIAENFPEDTETQK